MQILKFEAKWEKAIAPQDRKYIEQLFEQTNDEKVDIHCTIIRQARNYKDELLVSVIIHNFTDESLLFNRQDVFVHSETQQIMQSFTIPQLSIGAKTSMPWTFILKDAPQAFVAMQVIIPISPYEKQSK